MKFIGSRGEMVKKKKKKKNVMKRMKNVWESKQKKTPEIRTSSVRLTSTVRCKKPMAGNIFWL